MADNKKLIPTASLAEAIQARDLETKALDALEECLAAECRVYDLAQKELVIYPDGKTRLGAAMGILAYSAGKPVERKIIVDGRQGSDPQELMKRIVDAPELRKTMRYLLEQAEKGVLEVEKT